MNRKERREKNKEINIFEEVVQIIKQYFPELLERFDKLTDVRHQSYKKYEMRVIFLVRLLGLMSEIKSMNELSRELNTEEAIENIAKVCGIKLDELPHHDTINNIFKGINIEELEEVNRYVINKLIRSKMLDKYRVSGRYFHIVVDGTGIATSRKKYNDNCVVKNKTDKMGKKYKEYSTYVLEAKLVAGDMVFSIGTEFVENKEDIEKNMDSKKKQDCEIKAFKRLADKIKLNYPKLNIIISGDALYSKVSVIEICEAKEWKYIITFKEGTMPALYSNFEGLIKKYNESNKVGYDIATNVEYAGHKINVMRYKEKGRESKFTYITNLSVSNKNVEEKISLGRKRWKIENEGFNIQKNGTFDIGHLYSKNQTAIKVHYMLIQIGHAIRQLLEKGLVKIREMHIKIREISQLIKKALTSRILNLSQHNKIQLRFYD